MAQDTPFDLKSWREAAGLSQQELADTLGKSRRTIQSWDEAGADRLVELACLYLTEHPEAIIRQRRVGRPKKATSGAGG